MRRSNTKNVSKVLSLFLMSALLFIFVVFGKVATIADVAEAAGLDSLPSGTYTITLTGPDGTPFATGSLTVTGGGAGSTQLSCPAGTTGTYPNCTTSVVTGSQAGALPGATVTIDGGSVINANTGAPTISGTASGVSSLTIAIAPLSGGNAAFMRTVSIDANGRWTVTVNPALPNGSYLTRFSSGATSLYNALLNVTGSSATVMPVVTTTSTNTTTTSCPAVGQLPACASGMTSVSLGTDSNGCARGFECRAAASGTTFTVGDRVQTIGNANVRSLASITGTIAGVQSTGASGSIIGGPITADNYEWWQVNFDTGADGWTVKDNIMHSGAGATVGTSMATGYTLSADKVSGPSPLLVNFSYHVPSGDNPNNIYIVRPFDGASLFEANPYVYEVPGTYTASLFQTSGTGAATQRATVQTLTIHVDPPTSTSGANTCSGRGGTWSAPADTGSVPSTSQPIESYMWYYPKTAADTGLASVGTQFTYACRPYPMVLGQYGSYYNPGVVWKGSANGTYGVNSDVCAAAISAGLITASVGGTVKIERVAPQYVYPTGTSVSSPGTSVADACTLVPGFKFVTNGTASGSQTSTTASASGAFTVGGRVKTANNSNVRNTPSVTGSLNGVQLVDVLGTVLDGPITADGYTWWKIDFDNSSLDGWTIEGNLAASDTSLASIQQAANIAYTISQIPIAPATCPYNSTGTFPNCMSSVTDANGNTSTLPAVRTINYSQYRPTNLGSAPVGSNLAYYCTADYHAFANQPTSGVNLSGYQPYYTVYGGSGGIYNMYSDLCASAVQAGVITSADGGTFVIQTVAAQAVTGTSANGITSYDAAASPAYKFVSLPIGQQSPARITSVSPTSGQSPLTVTFTVSNIPPTTMPYYTLRTRYTDSSQTTGSYVLDQVQTPFATVGTKTITFTIPGTDEISLWQMEVSAAGSVTYHVLDTKTITITAPPPSVTVTYLDGNPLYANFQFNWLEPGTYTLDDGSSNTSANGGSTLGSLGYVSGGSVSTARGYPAAGTYTIRLLKGSTEVLTKTITLPHQ